MSLFSLENLLQHHSQSALCAYELPDYYFVQATSVSCTGDMYELYCTHHWSMRDLQGICVQRVTCASILHFIWNSLLILPLHVDAGFILFSVHVYVSGKTQYSTVYTNRNFSAQTWTQVAKRERGSVIFQACYLKMNSRKLADSDDSGLLDIGGRNNINFHDKEDDMEKVVMWVMCLLTIIFSKGTWIII